MLFRRIEHKFENRGRGRNLFRWGRCLGGGGVCLARKRKQIRCELTQPPPIIAESSHRMTQARMQRYAKPSKIMNNCPFSTRSGSSLLRHAYLYPSFPSLTSSLSRSNFFLFFQTGTTLINIHNVHLAMALCTSHEFSSMTSHPRLRFCVFFLFFYFGLERLDSTKSWKVKVHTIKKLKG